MLNLWAKGVGFALPYIQKYAGSAVLVLLATLVGGGMFLHWKSGLIDQGYQKAKAECIQETATANAIAISEHEAEVARLKAINLLTKEDFNRALRDFNARLPTVVIKRVPVHVVSKSCDTAGRVSGNTDSGSGNTNRGGQLLEAELDPRVVANLERWLQGLTQDQKNCGFVGAVQKINQGDQK